MYDMKIGVLVNIQKKTSCSAAIFDMMEGGTVVLEEF